jgi:flagellar biosynthesis chaperone FliJ
MSTFRYRLEVLLEQKQKALEEAQRLLGERLAQVRTEKARLVELQMEAEQAKERAHLARQSRFQTGGPVTAQEIQSRSEEARWLEKESGWARDRVIEKRIAIEDAEDAAEQARQNVVEANRQVEVLKTHRSRQEQRFRKEQERLESIAMDDAGNAQFLRRSRE